MDYPTDPLYGPPQNRVKIIDKDFAYGLSNRLLMSGKFPVLHCTNGLGILTPPSPPPPQKKMHKSCFQRKEMPKAKRRKVLTFHSWLNLAMEDVFLGCLSLFISVIPLSKL